MTYRRAALAALLGLTPGLMPGSALGTALAQDSGQRESGDSERMRSQTVTGTDGQTLRLTPLETFDGAWAMTFLPGGEAIVTEKGGAIWRLGRDGKKMGRLTNAPRVTARNQGGMGDFILGPDYGRGSDRTVYLSYVERDSEDDSLSGAVVERARLLLGGTGGQLSDREIIWRQSPKVTGNGHYGHRLAVSPVGSEVGDRMLMISSGERQKFTPAQNMDMNLGKMIRLNLDGSVPEDNPFYDQGGVTAEIWSLGHRNPLGIDFDADGVLWEHEMGPRHGDELNRIVRAENYGYPEVSNGDHYSGEEIPDHSTRPEFENPALWWDPAISPAGFVIYKSNRMPAYTGNGFIGGLSSQALVRVGFSEATVDNTGAADPDATEIVAEELGRYEWGARIREVEQGPDGYLYVLEDQDGRLLRLAPAE